MNEASRWRLALARDRIAPAYAADPRLAAMAVVGSVAIGRADGWSDLDLVLWWQTAPELDFRGAIIAALGGQDWSVNDAAVRLPDLALQARSDRFYLDGDAAKGLKVDLTHVLALGSDRLLANVVESGDSSPAKLSMIGSIQRALPLVGAERIAAWAEAAGRCPEPIARGIVETHLRLYAPWTLEMLGEREDALRYQAILLDDLERLLWLLCGINRVYPPEDTRQLASLVERLALAPPDLDRRMREILAARPIDAPRAMARLASEVLELVEAAMPDLSTEAVRSTLTTRRARRFGPGPE